MDSSHLNSSTLPDDGIKKDQYCYNRPSLTLFSMVTRQRLQQRRHRSVLRPDVYVCQITCTPLSWVQIVRSISSRSRFKCPRVATVPNGPIRHGLFKLLSLSVNYYYNTTKVEVYRWVWVPIRRGGLRVMNLAGKLSWSMSRTSHSGGQRGGGASTVSTVNTPNTSRRSNQKCSRENSNLDHTSDFHKSKKQKQKPSGSQSFSQTSTAVPTHVDFKCVTININGFSEEKWKQILSLPIIQSILVIILTEHHLSGTFRPKEVIDSGWNIWAVARVPKRRGIQHQHRGGVAADDTHIYAGDFTKFKLPAQRKKETPSHLDLRTVIEYICPHHLPQLPSQIHAYILHCDSETASSSKCPMPLPFSSSMVDLMPLTIPSHTHSNAKMKPPSRL